MTVYKRPITITPLPLKKTYDGQVMDYPTEMPKEMKLYATWTNLDNPLIDGEVLLSGDYLDCTSIVLGERLINVGETSIHAQGACVKYENGRQDNNQYYEVTVEESTAVICPVQLTIASLSHTKIYDGTALEGGVEDCYIHKGELFGADRITYVVDASQTEVGSSMNLIVKVIIYQGSKIVGYFECDENGLFIDGNLETYNYEINVQHGELIVVKDE